VTQLIGQAASEKSLLRLNEVKFASRGCSLINRIGESFYIMMSGLGYKSIRFEGYMGLLKLYTYYESRKKMRLRHRTRESRSFMLKSPSETINRHLLLKTLPSTYLISSFTGER
jgi:hypothetical protein